MDVEEPQQTEKENGDDDEVMVDGTIQEATNDSTMSSSSDVHCCELQVLFPTNVQAEQAMQVLQVDEEPSNRVTKTFRLHTERKKKDKTNATTTAATAKDGSKEEGQGKIIDGADIGEGDKGDEGEVLVSMIV